MPGYKPNLCFPLLLQEGGSGLSNNDNTISMGGWVPHVCLRLGPPRLSWRFDALAVVRPIGFYLLDFFCSRIQFYLLLSPYLCFISFLYLDLYVLGDDALIS